MSPAFMPFDLPRVAPASGTGKLAGGTATIDAPAVTALTPVLLTVTAPLSLGFLAVTSVTAGAGFTVTSADPLDASTFTWVVL